MCADKTNKCFQSFTLQWQVNNGKRLETYVMQLGYWSPKVDGKVI